MRSSFDRQLRPCFDSRLSGPPLLAAKADPSPVERAELDAGSAPARLLQTTTSRDSLKVLLAREGSAESLRLYARLTRAALDTKCLLRATFVAGCLFVLSFGVLASCALLLPDFFFNSPYFAIKVLTLVCVASFISEVEFLGCRLWHNIALTRLRRECHQLLLPSVESQPRALQDLVLPPGGKPLICSPSTSEKSQKKE